MQERQDVDDGQGGTYESWHTLFNVALNSNSNFYVGLGGSGAGFYYQIPWSFLANYLRISNEYDYIITYDINNSHIVNDLYVTYGGLTPEDAIHNAIANNNNLTREQIAQTEEMINQQEITNEQLQDVNDNLNSVNDSINDLNDNITDDNITTTAANLPSIDVNDPTKNRIELIFNNLYNAFCTGTAQDIVFPVPNTNQSFTLSANYVSYYLSQSNAQWLITFITAFWWYKIGSWIVYDIYDKIKKIQTGDIEDVEKNNVKVEML